LNILKNYIWSVAGKLVKEHGFSFIDLESNNNTELPQIHLLKNKKGKYIYIRLAPFDFVWPNHLMQDLEQAKKKAAEFASRLNTSELSFINLYIFLTPPTTDIHQLIADSSRISQKRLEVYNGYIQLEDGKIGVSDDTFDIIDKEVFTYYLSHPDENDPEEIIKEMKDIEQKREQHIKSIFEYGKPIFTYIFILINTIMFLLMEFKGGSANTENLLQFGAKESFLITNGEMWRLVTPIFLHIGLLHFALNNMALFYLGKITERIYGTVRFTLIYLLAGIIGNIASFIFAPTTIGAGASGAIFGLFGALLYFGYTNPDLFFRTLGRDVLTVIGVNLVFGIVVPNIDNYAHIGGLIGGFVIAAILHLPKQKRKKWLAFIFSIFIIIGITFTSWWGIYQREPKGSEALVIIGEKAIDQGDTDKAYKIFEQLVKQYPERSYHHFYYANILFQKGNKEQAKEHYNKAIELQPNFPQAYYNLALIAIFEKSEVEARQYLEKALKIDPNFTEATELLKEIK